MRVIVLGHGGFGKRMPSILRDMNDSGSNFELVGFLDKSANTNVAPDGSLIGDDTALPGIDASYIVAIADPVVRQRLDQYAVHCGKEPATVTHPAAYIETPTVVGPGGIVLAGVCVDANAQLGRQVLVNVNTVIGHDARIGSFTTLSPLAMIGGGATLGERVLVGAGAVVLPGCAIGDGVVIGAGAVVTRDIPSESVAVGAPARVRCG